MLHDKTNEKGDYHGYWTLTKLLTVGISMFKKIVKILSSLVHLRAMKTQYIWKLLLNYTPFFQPEVKTSFSRTILDSRVVLKVLKDIDLEFQQNSEDEVLKNLLEPL